MAANYTLDELRIQEKRIVEDLKQLRSWWQSNSSAGSINAEVTLMIDNNSWTAAEMSRIITSEYFNVPSFGLVDSGTKRKAKSLISRLKSNYSYLVEYEKRQKERKEKDKIEKVKKPKEKEILKKVERQKQKSNSLLYKTPSQIADDFSIQVDKNITNAIYDFETRWNNNDEKVGNVFVSNYESVKNEFQKSLNEAASPYMQIANYYNQYATQYGFGDLVKDSLDCLIKNTPLSIVKEAFDEAQAEIDAFIKDADAVITESLNIVDQSIGIVEEIYDASKEINKEFKDYEASLEDQSVPTSEDAVRNQMRQRFLNVLLPAVTKQVSDVLQAVVNGVCDENEVAVFDISSIVDGQGLENQLKSTYGIGDETLEDYLAMLMDVSAFITPIELCQLFNGEASDQTLDLIINFIASFYKKIYLRMNTRQRVSSFFVLISKVAETGFCKDIDFNKFNETFCGGGDDEYSIELRKCLAKRDPELAKETREVFLAKKKQQIKDALAYSYFPMDLRADQQAINKVFEDIEKQQTAEPLTRLAMGYKRRYKEALTNMSQYFVANFQLRSGGNGFIEEKLQKVKDQISEEEFKRIISAIPREIPVAEKQILPDFVRSLFVNKSEITYDNYNNSVEIFKTLRNDDAAKANLKSSIENMLNANKANIPVNKKALIYNPEITTVKIIRELKYKYYSPKAGEQKSEVLFG